MHITFSSLPAPVINNVPGMPKATLKQRSPLFFGAIDTGLQRSLTALATETFPQLRDGLLGKATAIKKGETPPLLPEASPATAKNGEPLADTLIITTPSNNHYRLRAVPSGKFTKTPTSSRYTTKYTLYEMERVYPEADSLIGQLHKWVQPKKFPVFQICAYKFSTTVEHWIRPSDPRATAHYGSPQPHESGFRLSGEIPEIGPFDLGSSGDWNAGHINTQMQAALGELFEAGQQVIQAREQAKPGVSVKL